MTVSADRAVLQDGTLAGSIFKICDAARYMLQMHCAIIRDIISMASVNPAKQIGMFGWKAGITAGKDADILLVDDKLNLKYTICRGVIAYEEDE